MPTIIINADDFGLKPSVNLAIVELFNNKLINSTTIMANMPSFDEAIELAHKNKIADRIGAHLTLTEGIPLTPQISSTDLFYKENNYDLKKHKKQLFWLTKSEKKLIFEEFSAQIEKIKKSGILITHIDTHNHVHETWPITKIIFKLLKKYDIPYMRILNNLNKSTKLHKIAYRSTVNKIIHNKKVNFSNFFGNQSDSFHFLRNNPDILKKYTIEIMVHPDYNTAGIVVDKIRDKEETFEYSEDIVKLIKRFLYF